jgi:predicted RNA-binding Zn-ribbon protein involved in translation (DUF1610 family)
MAVVMIKCSQTGRDVSTGIETDAETFERLPDLSTQLQCPQCGRMHVWRKAEAFLVDAPRGPTGSKKA